jgi:hypothetical protein
MKRLVRLRRTLVLLSLIVWSGCHAPVTIVTPQGQAAYTADQVVVRINELENAAIAANAANAATPQGLGTSATRTIVAFAVSADTTLAQVPAGWQATVKTAWAAAKMQLGTLSNPLIVALMSAVDAVLEGSDVCRLTRRARQSSRDSRTDALAALAAQLRHATHRRDHHSEAGHGYQPGGNHWAGMVNGTSAVAMHPSDRELLHQLVTNTETIMSALTDLQAKFDALAAAVTQEDSDINATIAKGQAAASALKAQITALQASVSAGTAATPADLQALSAKADALVASVNATDVAVTAAGANL